MDQDRDVRHIAQPRVELWTNRILCIHHLRHRGVDDPGIHQSVYPSIHSPRLALRLALERVPIKEHTHSIGGVYCLTTHTVTAPKPRRRKRRRKKGPSSHGSESWRCTSHIVSLM